MPLQNSSSETLATTQHWMRHIQRLADGELLPHRLPVDTLIFLARVLAMYRTDALYDGEMKGVRELMYRWIERLLIKQGKQAPTRMRTFRKHWKVLLPQLTDELEHWIGQALLARQIGYPLTHAQISVLFLDAFSEVEHPALAASTSSSQADGH
jgi:hypothetical protein